MAPRLALLLTAAVLSGCAATAARSPAPVTVPAAQSVAEADAALARAATERAALESAYAAAETACYDKFFVNRCIDRAREARRAGLMRVRAVEVEMERYKRQVRVDERDRELAQAEAAFQAEQARLAAEPPPPRQAPDREPPAVPTSTPAERKAEHEAELKRKAAAERAAAPERARKAQAAAERRRRAAERQAEVARKKAERAAKAQQSD